MNEQERTKIPAQKRVTKAPAQKSSLQRASVKSESTDGVPPIVNEILKSPGEPLDAETKAFMEPRFGHDFSQVHVHTDEKAAESARAVNALAYTVGQDVVFDAGQYEPETNEGKRLLAHELTHVVQQQQSAARSPAGELSHPGDPAEREGEAVAGRVLAGEPAQIHYTSNANVVLRARGDTEPAAKNDAGIMATDINTVTQEKSEPGAEPTIKDEDKKEGEPKELKQNLDQIEQQYRAMVKASRDKGYNVAADNLERFLNGAGGTKKIDVSWLRGFSVVTASERVNQERFESSLNTQAKGLKDGASMSFHDHWDRKFTASVTSELYYASGTSTITSTGDFSLTRSGDVVAIDGVVNHHWWDPYDWHEGLGAYIPGFGSVSDEDALLMQKYRGAKPFQMEADWTQTVKGTVIIRGWWRPNTKDYEWKGP